jgi:hypothetical protein
MWLAALTTLVGGLMLLAQYFQNRAATALEEAQSSLANEQERQRKDREEQVSKDLHDRELEIASLNLERAKLEERILEMGPRAVLLQGKRGADLVTALKPFTGQKVQVRDCQPNTMFNEEASGLSRTIKERLIESGWKLSPALNGFASQGSCRGTGMWIGNDPTAPDATKLAARALWDALNHVPLDVTGRDLSANSGNPGTGTDTVIIVILPHSYGQHTVGALPVAFDEDEQLGARNEPERVRFE